MASVDDRVVAMQFDNVAFERKIATTMASLDALKTKLDFSNSQKGLSELSTAASKFNMHGMSVAIEGISAKFLAMSTIAITALSNVVNKAVDSGIKLVKSLSLDPIMQGFQEYETNMKSIQTVLANTQSDGTNLEDVNAALDQLNEYSDQTIYNFSEMARNIGTFTAAGVDLDTSVNAIKGIANLAAISGSSSEQASSAMYQLSQALASGSVKLMDWNSIVNAGMGGEVFQKQLFDMGVAAGTLKDVELGTTFDEWKEAGNTFRNSLETGWLTSDVLTATLSQFTGDLTAEQLKFLGYSEAQTAELLKLGETGKDAATKVKTLTQLMQTVKESVGSGWSSSFRIVIGDFEEAKTLFTGLSDAIGGYVGRQADSRNELLQGWKDMGGRNKLIAGLRNSFEALASVVNPIKDAFSNIFPPLTVTQLVNMTRGFRNFTENLKLSEGTAKKVQLIFQGFFAAIEIGIHIVKGIVGVIGDLFKSLAKADGGNALNFIGIWANKLLGLNKALVEDGGIAKFFDELPDKIKAFIDSLDLERFDGIINFFKELPGVINEFVGGLDVQSKFETIVTFFQELPGKIEAFLEELNPDFSSFDGVVTTLTNFKDIIKGLFEDGIELPEAVSNSFGRLEQRFEGLKSLLEKLNTGFDGFKDKLNVVKEFVGNLAEAIKENLIGLGDKLAEALGPGEFDATLDAVNVGLLGGIAALLYKFVNGGLKLDFGNGLLDGLKDTLGALTGQLEAMQTSVKADAILKIAIAVGILTASMLVLSMIDSDALTKALIAMSIGFGQLIGAFAALTAISSGPKGAAAMVTVAVGLGLLAGAVLILSFAVKNLAGLNWEELSKGMLGVSLLLGIISAAVIPISANSSGMIRAGIGIVAIALALNLLALAMKIFATMSWEELGKGLTGVAGGLAAIVLAMKLLPDNMVSKGVGLLAVGVALNLIAASMKIFATMSWEDIGKGLAGVGGSLLIIAAAMKLMPGRKMIATGAGLILVSVALNLIALAVKSMSDMSWEDMGKGILGLAVTLAALALAAHAMSGALAGALAIAVIAGSLWLLADVLKAFSEMSISEIGIALLGIAGVLATLGLAAFLLQPVIPAMLLLGIALLAIGAGFALFGIGAKLVVEAFTALAAAGKEGVDIILYAIDGLISRLPEFIGQLAAGVLLMAQTFLEGVPALIEIVGVILVQLLETIADVAPELADTVLTLITEMLAVIRAAFPDIVTTGYEMLISLLQGLRDNIAEITTLVAEIIVEFLESLTEKAEDLVTAGLGLLEAVLLGISENIGDVAEAAFEIITSLLEAIAEKADDIILAGAEIIVSIIEGLGKGALAISLAAAQVMVDFLEGLSKDILMVVEAGFNFIVELLNGIADGMDEHIPEIQAAGRRIASELAAGMTLGLSDKAGEVVGAAVGLANKVTGGVLGKFGINSPSKVFRGIAHSLAEGMVMGLDEDTTAVKSGLSFASRVTNTISSTLAKIPSVIADMDEFNPVITPVLDLTNVTAGANSLNGLLNTSRTFTSGFSIDQANVIAASSQQLEQEAVNETFEKIVNVNFTQTNTSPVALSDADIYRQTNNLLALQKDRIAEATR